MAEVQTVYTDTLAVGYKGMVANGELSNRISRTCEASGGIGFGVPAYRGAGDHGCVPTQTLAAVGAAGTPAPAGATITASPTVGATAKIGVYTATCITAGATGKWRIEDPDGNYVGVATTGTEFVGGGLTFTITDTGTDPAVGENFTITVAGNELLGITIAHQCLGLLTGQTADKYQQYDNVAILPRGVIFVEAGASVADGDNAFADTDANFVATSGVPMTGWKFDTTGVDGDIVKLAKR